MFRLFGYAGSGKSIVLKFALDDLGLSPHRSAKDGTCVPGVVTATFTGKANLIDFRLLPGHAHDLRRTVVHIEGLTCGQLLADRAFDANWLRCVLAAAGIVAVIPPKSNRRFPVTFDRHTYKWRHLIENFFQKLKEYRSIAMRCCKIDTSCAALVALAATILRLK